MGFTTREVECKPLSSIYPAFYIETQYLNWCPIDVVVTDMTGRQTTLPAWNRAVTGKPHVAIETRSCNGPRTQMTKTGYIEKPIPGKIYTVNNEEFSSYPTRVDELGIILSTKEMALIAKDMVRESGYRYNVEETYSDMMTVDPRFVFEVKDPFNRWDKLYVHVLGMTVELRCGHKGQIIPDLDESTLADYNAECTLSCYLRYPTNYVQSEREVVPVFTINLSDIDRGEPYRLPTGDVICVASSYEALQAVLARKHIGSASPNFAALGMVSKDVHDQLVKQLNDKIAQERATAADQLRALKAKHDLDASESSAKIKSLESENENLKRQIEYFNTIQKAMNEDRIRYEKLAEQREKSRAEAYEASQKGVDRTYTAIKAGAALAATAVTFIITTMAKKK